MSSYFNVNETELQSCSRMMFTRVGLKSEKYRRQVEELIVLFPDCDPLYLEYCCQFYEDNHVERICEKIFNSNQAHYPSLPPKLVRDPLSTASKNFYLDSISELFPDCDLTYLRELISSLPHNILYSSIESLLLQNNKYPRRPHFGRIDKTEYFKTEPYKKGGYFRLLNLFPKIPKSSIKAVLAETNYNFIETYDRLSQLAIRHNWVSTLLSYFNTRKPQEDPSMYTLELLEELSLLENRGKETNKLDSDLALAQDLNNLQYEEENQTISCGCCYLSFSFEELCQCIEGHLFCRGCVNRYVSEAVFGQSNFKEKGCILCIDTNGCIGTISDQELSRVLEPELFSSYQNAIFELYVDRSSLNLVRCPFCRYVEVDQEASFRNLKWRSYLFFGVTLLALRRILVPWRSLVRLLIPLQSLFLALSIVGLLELSSYNFAEKHPTWSPKFILKPPSCSFLQCRSPECGKFSCRLCFQQCLPSHKCLENEKDDLRLKIEQAMAEAVKRTCPDCNLSFTKLDGCNKMTCRCGYIMCYLCRQGIKDVLYGHFCDHFRCVPGESCRQCNKCDLYKDPNDDAAMAKAARKAKKQFLLDHPELAPQSKSKRSLKFKQNSSRASAIEEFSQGFNSSIIDQTRDFVVGWFFY